MQRKAQLSVMVTAACLVATGCGGSVDQAGDHDGDQNGPADYASGGTFTIAVVDYDYGDFDPYRDGVLGFDRLVYDSLVNLRPDGEFVSGLAEDWVVDAESATFTLRPDVTCSDGTPLTASQVADDLNFLRDPANGSLLYGVTIPSVPFAATGDDATRTVTVVMDEPFGLLLNTIGMTPIMCAKGLAEPAALESGSDGTGPFVLTDIVPGQTYTFTVREDYVWGPDGAGTTEPGTPETVVLRVVNDETTAANLLLSGELNLARIGGSDRQRLDAQGLDKFEWNTSGAWLWFNQLGGRPFADQRVRQALVQALDLDEVISVNTGGVYGGAATGLVESDPKPCPGDTVAGQLPEQDRDAAVALLDRAGWTAGADGVRRKDGVPLTIDLRYVPAHSPFNQPTAELVSQQWDAIGVQVTLAPDSVNTMSQVLFQTSDYDVYMQGFGPTLPTQMIANLSGPVPPSGSNIAGIDNSEYTELVAQAQTLTPPDACDLWARAEQALWRELNPVPIARRSQPWYLQGAEAETNSFEFPIPTSIRMLG